MHSELYPSEKELTSDGGKVLEKNRGSPPRDWFESSEDEVENEDEKARKFKCSEERFSNLNGQGLQTSVCIGQDQPLARRPSPGICSFRGF